MVDLLNPFAFFCIIYLLITNKNSFNEKIRSLENQILQLQHLLKQGSEDRSSVEPVSEHATNSAISLEEKKQEQQHILEDSLAKSVAMENYESHKETITDRFSKIRRPVKTGLNKPAIGSSSDEPIRSFFDRHPDFEKFIGENLINKIGIAILVLAIGFFVKYAIDSNWIGPVGRVVVGVLCGGILIGFAHRLHHSYKAFSSVLMGGGLAILYLTMTLAYHQFHLFDKIASFIILIGITCLAVALSLLYDKQELAVVALAGGLLSPFIVSGEPNYHALFIYLIILNSGLLIIAYNKSWRVLNALGFVLTGFVFWAIACTLPSSACMVGLLYATMLYLLFFYINIVNNVRENKKFIVSDFAILLANAALYSAVGLCFLTLSSQEQLRGLFAIGLAVINFAAFYLLFTNKKVDVHILYLLVGIALTFLSLAAPIQLHGHYITLFWAAEAVLLYWFYQKSAIQLIRMASLAIWGFMLISLWMDWLSVYSSSTLVIAIITNKGFVTTLVASISSYLLYTLMNSDKNEEIDGINGEINWFKYAAFALLFLSGLLEINHQFLNHYPDVNLNSLYLMLYVPAFVFFFYMLSKRVSSMQLDGSVSMAILAGCIMVYLLLTQEYFNVQRAILVAHKTSIFHFVAHWVGAVFITGLFYELILMVKQFLTEELQKIAYWVLAGVIVLFLSLEICLVSNFLFYPVIGSIDHIQTIYIKVGLPILWGLASFALMWLGMQKKIPTLRFISLTLFSITLFKLFVFDIQNIPPAGKIVAFFFLGALLLIVSFMYQKVKKIIIEGDVSKRAE